MSQMKQELAENEEQQKTKDKVLEQFMKQIEKSENARSEIEFKLGEKNLEYLKIISLKDNMIYLASSVCRKYVMKKNDHQIRNALRKIMGENPEHLDDLVRMYEQNKCKLKKYIDEITKNS